MRLVGAYITHAEVRNAYRTSVGKPQEKNHFGRPSRRWEDDIKMDFK